MQPNETQMGTDDLRAALGFSTNLMSQMLPQDEPITPETPQEPELPRGQEEMPEVENPPQTEEKPQENDNRALLDEMRGMMERMKEEIITEVKKE